jgi:asparagine N-glycosylation enzyme membrane subunit Stt3
VTCLLWVEGAENIFLKLKLLITTVLLVIFFLVVVSGLGLALLISLGAIDGFVGFVGILHLLVRTCVDGLHELL